MQDSGWFTGRNRDGSLAVGGRFNNPCNVRCLDANTSLFASVMKCESVPGNGIFAKFNTREDGIAACVELYSRKYRGLNVDALVSKWANTHRGRNPSYVESIESCF